MSTMELRTTCLKSRPVFVTVYVEKTRKKYPTYSNNHHHDYHLHIDCVSKNVVGYNRRAELLSYSRRLREHAKSTVTSSPPCQPKSSVVSAIKEQQPSPRVIPSEQKQNVKKGQSCFERISLFKFNNSKTKRTKGTGKTFLSKVMATVQR